MKELEYREGLEALENFKEGMKALFKVPKDSVVSAEKRKRRGKASSTRPKCTQTTDFRQELELESILSGARK
jgi:hypothetical protein